MEATIEHEEVIGQFKFAIIQKEHLNEAIDFYFDVYVKGDPSYQSLGGVHRRDPKMVQQIMDIINDGVSLMALDTEDNDKLVGVRFSFLVHRSKVPPKLSLPEYRRDYPEPVAAINYLTDQMMWPGDIFAAHEDINTIYDMFALAVHPNYRGRGLATNLVRQALEVAGKANCDGVLSMATSDYSRRIFVNLGMSELNSKAWNDCVFDAQPLFGNVKSERLTTHFKKMMTKMLPPQSSSFKR